MLYEDLTRRIIGCGIEVHKRLGNGFQEAMYQRALDIEMAEAALSFEREKTMTIFYRDQQIGRRRVDFFVEGKIMVELKAVIKLEECSLSTGNELY
jgi:GxxExxY protein